MKSIHPGKILMEEFLKPLGVNQYKLAKDISVPPRRINEIVHGKRSISADTVLRLSRYFRLSERFWLNLQARYDLEQEKDKLHGRIGIIRDTSRISPNKYGMCPHCVIVPIVPIVSPLILLTIFLL